MAKGQPPRTDRDEWREVVREVVGIHQVRQDDRQEIEADEDVGDASEPKVGLFEEEAQVTIAAHKEVRRDEDSDRVVDTADLARAEVVVDQDRDLHPSLPLVRLVAVQEAEVLLGRLHGHDAGDERDQAERAEGDRVVLLVFFQEQVGPIGDEEQASRETKDSERDQVFLIGEEAEHGRVDAGCEEGRGGSTRAAASGENRSALTSRVEVESEGREPDQEHEEGNLDPVRRRVLEAARLVVGEMFRQDVVASQVEQDARLDLADRVGKVQAVDRLFVEAVNDLVERSRDGQSARARTGLEPRLVELLVESIVHLVDVLELDSRCPFWRQPRLDRVHDGEEDQLVGDRVAARVRRGKEVVHAVAPRVDPARGFVPQVPDSASEDGKGRLALGGRVAERAGEELVRVSPVQERVPVEGKVDASRGQDAVRMLLSFGVDILVDVLDSRVCQIPGLSFSSKTEREGIGNRRLTKHLPNGRVSDKDDAPSLEACPDLLGFVRVQHAALGLPARVLAVEPSPFVQERLAVMSVVGVCIAE